MEMAENNDTAETCAQSFHTAKPGDFRSAHFTVDNNSIVQCLDLNIEAYHAPPNMNSIGIEHAGFSSQSRALWLDGYGLPMLTRSAQLTAWLCTTFNIPPIQLGVSGLLDGRHGICGHDAVSAAWHQTDHTDPGPGFPWAWYLNQVSIFMNGATDVPLSDADVQKVQQGILYYDLGPTMVNPLTVLTRLFSAVTEEGKDIKTLLSEIPAPPVTKAL